MFFLTFVLVSIHLQILTVFFLLIFIFIFQKTEEGWKKKKFKEKKPDKGKFVTPGVNQKNQAKMKRKAPS